ncbi:hypothetical protein QA612_19565 [Evansella sp. AB-P1]|uniref:hypothetical protein n=1 Tax=Evansella sp. AB-P1 TaxID=3037653 RepID=UPI00241E35E4|nr:hypothetical protein [Evansella sp. AB-P1]MDG5789659.1 hypothetical protein [Evansella sp. AB-P1]
MGILTKLFGQKKEKITKSEQKKTQSYSSYEEVLKEHKDLKDRHSKLYKISEIAQQLNEEGKTQELKVLLETAVYEMDSDIPYHFTKLAEIYETENDEHALIKLKERIVKEAKKKRNVPNGSNVKFDRMAEEIAFTLNLTNLSEKLAQLVKNTGLNKKQVVDIAVSELELDSQKANKLYKFALEKEFIYREKVKGVFQHFAK